MEINKVTFGDTTLIDLTEDTVTAGAMLNGVTAHNKAGVRVTGTILSKTSSDLSVSGATVVAPAGYYGSSASKSISGGAATTPATTITTNPTVSINSSTGVVTATYTGSSSVTPTVTAGYITTGTSGKITTTGSGALSLATKAAATYTPGTTNQTISSNQWLTGIQTIAGDSDLVAENIKSGVNIFGVSGTLSFITYYTGSTAPSSSLGKDGDIYLQS